MHSLILPEPERIGSIPRAWFSDIPEDISSEGTITSPWEDLPPGIEKIARSMFIVAGADNDAEAPDVEISYSSKLILPDESQLYNQWHVDQNALVVADRLPTEYVVGRASEDTLEEFESLISENTRGTSRIHSIKTGLGSRDPAAFADLINEINCRDSELRAHGLPIKRVNPRQIVKNGESVHRSPRNTTGVPIGRKVIAIIAREDPT